MEFIYFKTPLSLVPNILRAIAVDDDDDDDDGGGGGGGDDDDGKQLFSGINIS
jgi:hypothetical protein